MARVSPLVALDPPHRHFRSARHASVSAGTELAPAVDDERERRRHKPTRIRRQCGSPRDAHRASSSSSDPIRREPRHGTTGGRVTGYRVGVTARSWRSRASRPPSASPAQPPRRTALLGAAAGGARRQSPAERRESGPPYRLAATTRAVRLEGSRRSIRFVPGIGTTSPPWASSHDSASCRRVTPQSPASQRASRRGARLRSGCSPRKRGSRWRRSSCVSPSVVSTAPVGNPRPSGLTAPGRSPARGRAPGGSGASTRPTACAAGVSTRGRETCRPPTDRPASTP